MIFLFIIFPILGFLCTLTGTLVTSPDSVIWIQINKNSPKKAKNLCFFLRNYSAAIATFTLLDTITLIANVILTNSVISSHSQISYLNAVIALLLLILLTIIFPKILAFIRPNLSLALATPLLPAFKPLFYFFDRLFKADKNSSPFMLSSPLLAKWSIEPEDFLELLEMAEQHKIISEEEKNFISHIISLNKLSANEIMRYRSQLDFVYFDTPLEETIIQAKKFKHKHLPVFSDSTENEISYILNTRKLLITPTPDLSDALELPACVPKSINLLRLFQSLRQQNRGLAVVLDELGNITGVVTTEDLIEEVIGTIRGEISGNAFNIEINGRNSWEINASTQIEDLRRFFKDIKEFPDIQSIGGVLLALNEKLPTPGETIEYCGYLFRIETVQYGKIERITLKKISSKK